MTFGHPNLLWLLLVIPPALAGFFWWAQRSRQRLLTQFIQARLLSQLTVGISTARRKIRLALVVLAVAFLIITVARPQRGFDLQEISQRGLDIVVAVDTSKSMLATDIAPPRDTATSMPQSSRLSDRYPNCHIQQPEHPLDYCATDHPRRMGRPKRFVNMPLVQNYSVAAK